MISFQLYKSLSGRNCLCRSSSAASSPPALLQPSPTSRTSRTRSPTFPASGTTTGWRPLLYCVSFGTVLTMRGSPHEARPPSPAVLGPLCQTQGHGLLRRNPLTPDLPSRSEPARSTRLILEVMYFSSDKVRERACETSKQMRLRLPGRPPG